MGMIDMTITTEADSTSISSIRRKKEAAEKGDNSFTLEDFYTLFAAQLQNQDMMNPVDDSQFLAQMAQMATIQSTDKMIKAMEQMNTMTMTSYAFEFMGKEVVVAAEKEGGKEGELESIRGVVERVTLYEGQPKVYINDKAYDLSQVMEVFPATNSAIEPTVPDDENKDDNNEENDNKVEDPNKPPSTEEKAPTQGSGGTTGSNESGEANENGGGGSENVGGPTDNNNNTGNPGETAGGNDNTDNGDNAESNA